MCNIPPTPVLLLKLFMRAPFQATIPKPRDEIHVAALVCSFAEVLQGVNGSFLGSRVPHLTYL